MFGDWRRVKVPGAVRRDSPTGYCMELRAKSDNLMIFLKGGGVCYDDLFCAVDPANVDQSLPGESLLAAVLEIAVGVILPQRQVEARPWPRERKQAEIIEPFFSSGLNSCTNCAGGEPPAGPRVSPA